MSEIFVFGSNLAGRHGKGAALFARKNHGAIYGQGEGRQGNSYGIATKNKHLQSRTLDSILFSVKVFLHYAKMNDDLTFQVTKIGCGLAGFKEEDIAPMFKGAPANCELPEGWRSV
jgi:hypothetical protein